MLKDLFKIFNFKICTHPNVETSRSLSYCPDCGKLIRTNWYVIRCNCCGKKRIGFLKGGKVLPVAKYCTNCGEHNYEIEKINNLNYFDISFAVAQKEVENVPQTQELTQTWCEEVEILEKLRLLPNYLN